MKSNILILLLYAVYGIICEEPSTVNMSDIPNDEYDKIKTSSEKSDEEFKVEIPEDVEECYLLKSFYSKNTPGTVYFRSGSALMQDIEFEYFRRIDSNRILDWQKKNLKKHTVLFYYEFNIVHKPISLVLKKSGIVVTKSFSQANIIYDNAQNMKDKITKLTKYQRFNHFPTTWELGRKDSLWKNYRIMRTKFPSDYDYIPETYLLPEEKKAFFRKLDEDPESMWIEKPRASSRGRGIKVMTNREAIPEFSLLSRYISNPHLINNKKYDMRLYVLVTGFSPLKIYLFPEGLVRFATEEYKTDSDSLENLYMHVTNWSVNKDSAKFDIKNVNVNDDPVGSIWSIGALRRYFNYQYLNFDETWAKIKDIVAKTLISITDKSIYTINKVTKHKNIFYEIYGIDIMIDENLRPWLLEFNVSPSVGVATELDVKIKSALFASVFNTIGVIPYSHTDKDKENPKSIFEEEMNNCYKRESDSSQMECDYQERNSESSQSSTFSDVVEYSLDEFSRSGILERVFPLKSNIDYYSKFIRNPREENLVLWNYLKKTPQDI